MSYSDSLPDNTSLQIFNDDQLIFSSNGKWLHPLFEFEEFLKSYTGPINNLSSHDTAIGKAAAVLSVRAGIKKINAELLSENAKKYIDELNQTLPEEQKIQLMWKNLVPKLMCATENQLENLDDPDEMYFLLRQRAKLVQGVDISVENLKHPYLSKEGLSFNLKAGGHLMICGENGTGKTTLLKFIAGINNPESGTILIDGKTPDRLPKYTIGYIPQFAEGNGFSLSVEEVVGLGVVKNKKEAVYRSLQRTSSMHLAKRSFNSLSGGEKQKVQLARCLAQEAKVLLLDEPTASLDYENKKMVTDILRSLTISEIPTIIVVTHDTELTLMRGWEIINISGKEKGQGDNSNG